jgi:endonuclease V-like protein UPF0215 family
MRRPRFSHVVGFDDAPFAPRRQANVAVVGAVFAGLRLEGVLRGVVRQDGANATRTLVRMVGGSRFASHLQLVLMQGVSLGGFNVVDLSQIHDRLGIPVLVVARRAPQMDKIREVLLRRVPGGARKWELIERLGPMEAVAGVFVQRVGISLADAERVVTRFAVHGHIPEPLRTAHIIAGGIATGESRGRT